MAQLSAAFEGLVQKARSSEPDEQFVVEHEPFRLHRVVWCASLNPIFEALGCDPRVLALAAEALGSEDLVQILSQAHFKFPGDGIDFKWHQDASNRRYGTDLWKDIDGRGSFVQIAIAVDPMTQTNGPLTVLPGTHHGGFVADAKTGALPPGCLDLDRAVDLILEPGDAAVFGPFLLHGSGPNTGGIARRLFLQGYALPGANGRVYPGCGLGIPRTHRS